jgi:hypothetical protein
MSKGIKFKDNNYLDSSGVVHKRKLLSDILNELTGTVLWQNSNDGNDFAAQFINVNTTGYKWAKVLFKVSKNNDNYFIVDIPFPSIKIRATNGLWDQVHNADVLCARSCNMSPNNDGFMFEDCTVYGIGGYTYTNVSANNMMIPNRIIGYKYYMQ